MVGTHVVIIGGVSVNNKTHDRNPWNFINPAFRRAKAIKRSVVMIMYTPSYERRVTNQKTEHSSVDNPKKDREYFAKVAEGLAKKDGFTFVKITNAGELTTVLKNLKETETIDYFGHSNDKGAFLEYSSIEDSVSKDYWRVTDAANVPASKFSSGAVFASYGCNQGDPGGLAEALRKQWGIRTIGSVGKTDFEITGPYGGPTFPTSAGGYVEYPAPTKDAKGLTVYPPPRPLTYSKTSPPS